MLIFPMKQFYMSGLNCRLSLVAFCVALIAGASCSPANAALECYGCHGTVSTLDIRPEDAPFRNSETGGFQANHRTHMGGTLIPETCTKCHPGSSNYVSAHRDGFIKVSSRINASQLDATYKNRTSAWAQTVEPQLGICNNVNCHFESPTPVWGSNPALTSCSSCHGAPPDDGDHPIHFSMLSTSDGKRSENICARCHPDHSSESNRFAHATSVGKRALRVTFATGGTYTGYSGNLMDILPSQRSHRNGTCSGVYCHTDGNGGAPNITPIWNEKLPSGCSGCHGGVAASFKSMSTGKHKAHMNNHSTLGNGNNFSCAACHSKTVDADNRIVSSSHINSFKDYSGARAGRINDPGFGKCSVNYCHSTGMKQNQFWDMTSAHWNSTRVLNCNGCHGTAVLPNRSSAYAAGIAGEPAYQNSGPLSPRANSHDKHVYGAGLSDTTACARCHYRTVDSAALNKFRDYSTLHLDGSRDVSFSARASQAGIQARYSSTNQTCLNTYCHGSRPTASWGAASQACNSCHSADKDSFAVNTAGSHARHFESTVVPAAGSYNTMSPGNAGNKDQYQFNCSSCHASPPSHHADGPVDSATGATAEVHFGYTTATLKGSYSYGVKASSSDNGFAWTLGQCSDMYCHSNGDPFDKAQESKTVNWGGGASCNSCHYTGGDFTGLSGRHGKHTGVYYRFTCEQCHVTTVTGNGTIKDKTLHVNRVKDVSFTQGEYNSVTRKCDDIYCHSDALGRPPKTGVRWSDSAAMTCDSCHRYQGTGFQNMTSNAHGKLASYDWIRKYPCTYCHAATVSSIFPVPGKPPVDSPAGGIIHSRLVNGTYSSSRHVNKTKDVRMNSFWNIAGDRKSYAPASYDPATKVCNNVYCHSDGTTDPDTVKAFPWNWKTAQGGKRHAECNDCHGHAQGESCTASCHDGTTKFVIDNISTALMVRTGWNPGEEWKSAMPMFPSEGAGKPRANSHPRHMQTDYSCDECHFETIIAGGACSLCHDGSVGKMGESSHLNPAFHVNKVKDVSFRQGGSYNELLKSCSGTKCHGGVAPVWGESTNSAIICMTCHGTYTGPDTDDYGKNNGIKAQINLQQWYSTGHGRRASKGNYKSGNPPAAFPGNPCWYCHDNKVMHNLSTVNPFRLKLHPQFENRFEHECVYCHMERNDTECLSCHNTTESLAPQLANITSSHTASAKWPDGTSVIRPNHSLWSGNAVRPSCLADQGAQNPCHVASGTNDMKIHNNGSNTWTSPQKDDVKNQYMMMGVCLQCHDDDTGGKCTGCHIAPANNPKKYDLGYDPGSGLVKPKKATASSVHFGHKHYQDYLDTGGWDPVTGKAKGTWKGGKFCWDCHDPHGDANIFMIHNQVATETDGKFGIPKPGKRKPVVFTQKNTGSDYVKTSGTINGICNVCHMPGTQHYSVEGGDDHNIDYACTKCHEHRFTDSHADNNPCNTCHKSKPVPRHSGFGLPVDCVKCHTGTVGKRTDIIGQFMGQSHHVQGTPVTNRHCYQCHWESTPEGLINNQYHEGFNFRNYSTKKDKKVDLVIYGPQVRPTEYRMYSSAAGRATAATFLAVNISSSDINIERKESAKVTNHCLGCHSDQNNDTKPFDDCKTPRQYAWDLQSVAARYSQKGTTKWGKYSSTTVNAKYKVTKALSAHGNAIDNQGGWSPTAGTDSGISDTRAGFAPMSSVRRNVQCFDCHNSHGSKAGGVTSSYVSYSGLKNGGNLKEVTPGRGGYKVTYFAKQKANGVGVVNPYNAGAGQCFDCHLNAMKAEANSSGPPWGYFTTFGATKPIKGFRDAYKFGDRNYNDPYAGQVYKLAVDFKQGPAIVGGHFKASTQLAYSTSRQNRIDGLCTPCHDPHGVSPTLGDNQKYSVPLLKDTWMSSPYKEDYPAPTPTGGHVQGNAWGTVWYGQHASNNAPTTDPVASYNLDRTTFGTVDGTRTGTSRQITQDAVQFAGLCTRCHNQERLMGSYAFGTATSANKAPWKSQKRIHASVKGWGANKEHAFTCSKCHQPHNSALPRLMQTNCLDYQHRGAVSSGGTAWSSLKALSNAGAVSYRDSGCNSAVYELRGYPIASVLGSGGYSDPGPEASISCHVSRFAGNSVEPVVPAIRDFKIRGPASPLPAQWPDQNYWNKVTPWPLKK